MTWGAVITAAGAVVGAVINKKGADKQASGAQKGLDWTKQVYQDSQGNFQPYLDAGQNALAGLTALNSGDYSGFENSPDYLYARSQMLNGLDHSAASGGRLDSGGYPVDLIAHLNGLASQNLGNYRNSLQFLENSGQNAAGTLGGIGTGTSQQINNAYGNIGNAQASGYGAVAGGVAGVAGALNNWNQGRTQSSYVPVTQSNYVPPANNGAFGNAGY